MKKWYDLSGMKWIAAGSLVQIIVYLAENLIGAWGQSAAALSNALDAAGLIASILMIVGLCRVAAYSPALRGAKTNMLIALICSAAAVVLAGFEPGDGRSLVSAGALVAGVLLIAAAISGIIALYQLFRGCRDIAAGQRQHILAEQCRKAWYGYLVLFFAGVVLEVAEDMVTAKGGISSALAISAAAFTIAAKAMVCFMAWRTFREFHGKEIEEPIQGESRIQESMG